MFGLSSKDCVTLEAPAATVWCSPLIPEAVRKRVAKAPMWLLETAATRPVKISRKTLVLRTELPMDGSRLLTAVKYYCPETIWKAVAAVFRPSKAAQNWSKAEFLSAHGIATPQPLLGCQMRGWRSTGGSFLVSRWIDGENLHLFGWRIAERPTADRLRAAAECAESLGRLVGRMHAAGAAHRDLKAANLLVVEGDAGIETWLVDLDGLQSGRPIGLSRRARDLGRLAAGLVAHPWVGRSICRRFLRAYLRESPQEVIDWKLLWRVIAASADRIVRDKRRRGEEVL